MSIKSGESNMFDFFSEQLEDLFIADCETVLTRTSFFGKL